LNVSLRSNASGHYAGSALTLRSRRDGADGDCQWNYDCISGIMALHRKPKAIAQTLNTIGLTPIKLAQEFDWRFFFKHLILP
jgi:hypothetical protein